MSIGIFLGLTILLYFLSREVIKTLYFFLGRFLHHNGMIYRLVALIYFPGTLVHEMSHMLMAMLLNLKVRDIHLLPQIRGNMLRLGSVWYEKKDVVRGLVVGIAPFFSALFFFYLVDTFHLFSINYFVSAIVGYLLFSISSTMFSSKQDLVDFIYVVPIVVLVGVLLFVFHVNIFGYFQIVETVSILHFFDIMNTYLLFSLIMNGGMIILMRLILRKKR